MRSIIVATLFGLMIAWTIWVWGNAYVYYHWVADDPTGIHACQALDSTSAFDPATCALFIGQWDKDPMAHSAFIASFESTLIYSRLLLWGVPSIVLALLILIVQRQPAPAREETNL